MIYYAKSTSGFYDSDIHGANIPPDAREITAEYHAELLAGQAQGKIIDANDNGTPVLIDRPAPTTEELAAQARAQRDQKLADTSWLIERHHEQAAANLPTSLTAAQYSTLLTYRQALRDVPGQSGFPATINWPTLPEAIA